MPCSPARRASPWLLALLVVVFWPLLLTASAEEPLAPRQLVVELQGLEPAQMERALVRLHDAEPRAGVSMRGVCRLGRFLQEARFDAAGAAPFQVAAPPMGRWACRVDVPDVGSQWFLITARASDWPVDAPALQASWRRCGEVSGTWSASDAVAARAGLTGTWFSGHAVHAHEPHLVTTDPWLAGIPPLGAHPIPPGLRILEAQGPLRVDVVGATWSVRRPAGEAGGVALVGAWGSGWGYVEAKGRSADVRVRSWREQGLREVEVVLTLADPLPRLGDLDVLLAPSAAAPERIALQPIDADRRLWRCRFHVRRGEGLSSALFLADPEAPLPLEVPEDELADGAPLFVSLRDGQLRLGR